MREIKKLLLMAAIGASVSVLGQTDVNAEELLNRTDATLDEESLGFELAEESFPEVQSEEVNPMLGEPSYTWDENTKTLTFFKGNVKLPDEYKPSVVNVVYSEGVTVLGNWVLSDCTSLESVSLPSTLKEIGGMAFSGCKSLKSITIPNSVTKNRTSYI